MLETSDDRLAFLDAFGESVSISGGGSFTAIVDAEFASASFDGVDGEDAFMALWAVDAGIASVTKSSTLTVRSANYKLHRAEPDGTGWTRLVLRVA